MDWSQNDVRNISYIQFNQSIWLGSASDGITIINQQGMQKLTTERDFLLTMWLK